MLNLLKKGEKVLSLRGIMKISIDVNIIILTIWQDWSFPSWVLSHWRISGSESESFQCYHTLHRAWTGLHHPHPAYHLPDYLPSCIPIAKPSHMGRWWPSKEDQWTMCHLDQTHWPVWLSEHLPSQLSLVEQFGPVTSSFWAASEFLALICTLTP